MPTTRKRSPAKTAAPRTSETTPPPPILAGAAPVLQLAREMRRWADTMLGVAGSAAELSLNLAKANARDPKQHAAADKAGSLLRKARETAGMTSQELGRAIDLDDPALIERAERGAASLPSEVVLRLAGVLGRHDPTSFMMQLARSYNPQLWKALDDVGIGRLAVQAGRERELANVYRGNDDARELSDADFAAVLAFTQTAFDMAVTFRKPAAKPRSKAAS